MSDFTDLELLEGWAKSLSEFAEGESSSVGCWTTLRPTGPENDAIMRLGALYPAVVRQVQDFLDFTEVQYQTSQQSHDSLILGQGEAVEIFYQAVCDLAGRVESAVNTIVSFADTPDNKTDNKKNKQKKIPEDLAVLRVAKKIKKELPTGGTKTDIVRDFTGGNEKEAQRLMKQLQRYPDLLD